VETKIGSGKKCALSSSKVRAALKNSAKSYRELGWKSSSQHCQKVFDKDGNPSQSQKIYSTLIGASIFLGV
jgi:hypothetical protein